jgi:hypothetical protein
MWFPAWVTVDDVLALYRAAIYRDFVTGGDLPGRCTEFAPISRRLPRGTTK